MVMEGKKWVKNIAIQIKSNFFLAQSASVHSVYGKN